MPTPAQWNWGKGHPTGTVQDVSKDDPLSIQSSNGNTVTRNADPSNPAVHIKQDSGTEVVKRASELERLPSDTPQDNPEKLDQTSDGDEGENLKKPFPKPRQSAPISRPEDTEKEKEEAEMSIDDQRELAGKKDREEEGKTTTIHGHANGEATTADEDGDEKLMDLRGEVQTGEASPEKQPSVGDKRGRSEEPDVASSNEQAKTSGTVENGETEQDEPTEDPEPESKKPRVEEPAAEEAEGKASGENSESSEQPKKKAGRPKKEETKAVPGERKNSISSRTRSKASAENLSAGV